VTWSENTVRSALLAMLYETSHRLMLLPVKGITPAADVFRLPHGVTRSRVIAMTILALQHKYMIREKLPTGVAYSLRGIKLLTHMRRGPVIKKSGGDKNSKSSVVDMVLELQSFIARHVDKSVAHSPTDLHILMRGHTLLMCRE